MKPISWYKSLCLAKPSSRRDYGYFLIDGKRSVDHLLSYHRHSVHELLCINDIAPSYRSHRIPIRIISEANMKSISPSCAPQGIVALVQMPTGVYTAEIPDLSISSIGNHGINTNRDKKILLLEHVQDPGNVGTLIRTAAAFGVDGVIMSDRCADPFSPKVVQSTAGSLLSLWIRKTGSYLQMVSELKNRCYKLIAADLRGADFQSQECVGPSILALGNEGAGLSADVIDMSDCKVRIPISDSGAESLNVAVAGGILMFECQRNCTAGDLE